MVVVTPFVHTFCKFAVLQVLLTLLVLRTLCTVPCVSWPSAQQMDCDGICFGSAVIDKCGVCAGNLGEHMHVNHSTGQLA